MYIKNRHCQLYKRSPLNFHPCASTTSASSYSFVCLRQCEYSSPRSSHRLGSEVKENLVSLLRVSLGYMEEYRGSMSYYSILGLKPDCADEEIRKAYRKLAMQWHPDRWTKTPSLLGEAKRKFQQIQEAYEVLTDQRKRTLYNAGMYDPKNEYDEGFCDFLQEMVSLMNQVSPEEKNCTMEDLQTMFIEMAQDFDLPSWPCAPMVFEDASIVTPSKRTHWDSNLKTSNPPFHISGFAMYG